jgi:hypothetical protein
VIDSGAVRWRKSSYSSNAANCVEIARLSQVLVRDSKNVDGPVLIFPATSLEAFTRSV